MDRILKWVIVACWAIAGVYSAIQFGQDLDPLWLIATICCMFAVKYLPFYPVQGE